MSDLIRAARTVLGPSLARCRRTKWRTVACGAFIVLASASAPARAQGQSGPAGDAALAHLSVKDVDSILHAATIAGESGLERASFQLASLGARAIPVLFDALVARPGPTEPDATKPEQESIERRVLKRTLCQMPMPFLYTFFQQVAGPSATAERRAAVLDVLADCGSVVDLALIVKVTAESSSDNVVPEIVRGAMQRTVTRVLARDPRGFSILEGLFPGLAVELQADLLQAVARTDSDLGLKFLARALEQTHSLRLLALNLMGRMSSRVSRPVDELVLAEVRACIIERDAGVLPEAILLAGQLDDFDAAPHLVALLRDSRRSISTNAAWALRQMTGLRFRDDYERWTTWLTTEMGWWRTDASDILRRLDSSDPTEVRAALLNISMQHSFRHHLAEEVAPVLSHSDPGIVALACRTLGLLSSTVALDPLVECLDHADPMVRTNACNSLKAITRQNLPCTSEAWRAIVKRHGTGKASVHENRSGSQPEDA